ncbi:DGQHR domain-containing protein [Clostridium cagae]|uniref:DGQHR domain-containing protein n=1 Tax=Clostridium cagae TaxID=2080751 RepID=UPI003F75B0AA
MNDIKVIKYDWNNKGCYLGCITYGELKKLINFKSDKTVNRDVNPNRVKEIYEYIKENTINTFFPPIILNTFSKICYNTNKNSINTKGLSIKIIDGQHRINAILKVIEDDGDKFLNYKVPFLLIEELSEIMSRDIFNLVNTYQAKVEDNVADRLTPSVKCNILLKYISESKEKNDLQNIIEWNEKQADINVLTAVKVDKKTKDVNNFVLDGKVKRNYGVVEICSRCTVSLPMTVAYTDGIDKLNINIIHTTCVDKIARKLANIEYRTPIEVEGHLKKIKECLYLDIDKVVKINNRKC